MVKIALLPVKSGPTLVQRQQVQTLLLTFFDNNGNVVQPKRIK